MTYNIIVCDDDPYSLTMNVTYLESIAKKNRIELNLKAFSRAEDVLRHIESNHVDIAFLDIDFQESTELNGIKLAIRLAKKYPRVANIFITGHCEFALDAFNIDAFSYLTKPVNENRLEYIFKKCILHVNDMNSRIKKVPLLITQGNIKRKLNQTNILYIERVHSQSIIVMQTMNHSVYEAISSLVSRLDQNFVQINQGVIVNLDHVSSMKRNVVTMKTGEVFTIGRTFSKEAKRKYLEYPSI